MSYFDIDHIVFAHSFSYRPFHVFAFSFKSAISFVVNSSASASDNEIAFDKQAGSWADDDDDDGDDDDDADDMIMIMTDDEPSYNLLGFVSLLYFGSHDYEIPKDE